MPPLPLYYYQLVPFSFQTFLRPWHIRIFCLPPKNSAFASAEAHSNFWQKDGKPGRIEALKKYPLQITSYTSFRNPCACSVKSIFGEPEDNQ